MSDIININYNQIKMIDFIINQSFNSCGNQQESKEVFDKFFYIIKENYEKRIKYLNERVCVFQEDGGVVIRNRFL